MASNTALHDSCVGDSRGSLNLAAVSDNGCPGPYPDAISRYTATANPEMKTTYPLLPWTYVLEQLI
ncbi:MAG: hypothetical protein Q9159_005730 [Coniocarpon cinnabarinum]